MGKKTEDLINQDRAARHQNFIRLAQAVYPKGIDLICDQCGTERFASHQEIAFYFGGGWPKHCGQFMRQKRVE